jgi:hypothetical protein
MTAVVATATAAIRSFRICSLPARAQTCQPNVVRKPHEGQSTRGPAIAASLDEAAVEAARDEGRKLSVDEAVALALDLLR